MNTPFPNCTDYYESIDEPRLIRAEMLAGGQVVRKNGNILRYAGGFCIVFPFLLAGGKKVAVRCWTTKFSNLEKRVALISDRISKSGLPYFVGFSYFSEGIATTNGLFPVVVMDWVEGMRLKDYIEIHLKDPSSLLKLADEFLNMAKDLHKIRFSHGDLQHGNIIVSDSGKITLVDYDSMYVPGLENMTDDIKGLCGYQHPGRKNLKTVKL